MFEHQASTWAPSRGVYVCSTSSTYITDAFLYMTSSSSCTGIIVVPSWRHVHVSSGRLNRFLIENVEAKAKCASYLVTPPPPPTTGAAPRRLMKAFCLRRSRRRPATLTKNSWVFLQRASRNWSRESSLSHQEKIRGNIPPQSPPNSPRSNRSSSIRWASAAAAPDPLRAEGRSRS